MMNRRILDWSDEYLDLKVGAAQSQSGRIWGVASLFITYATFLTPRTSNPDLEFMLMNYCNQALTSIIMPSCCRQLIICPFPLPPLGAALCHSVPSHLRMYHICRGLFDSVAFRFKCQGDVIKLNDGETAKFCECLCMFSLSVPPNPPPTSTHFSHVFAPPPPHHSRV